MILPIICLVLGLALGRGFVPAALMNHLGQCISIALCITTLLAGMGIGANYQSLRGLARRKLRLLCLPVAVILGSLAGGLLAGAILGIPANKAGAVSAGFAYYSVSVGILTELDGPELAALAFMADALREMLALLLIPAIARYLSPLCTVAAGAATSMDTTLPAVSRYTDGETCLIALFSGGVLTVLVPVLVPLFYQLL